MVNALQERAENLVTLLTSFLIIFTLLSQVIIRFVFNSSLPWYVEATQLGYVWLVFIASSSAFHHKEHVSVSFVIDNLEKKGWKKVRTIPLILSILYLLLLIVTSVEYSLENVGNKTHMLEIPYACYYSAMWVGSILCLLWIWKDWKASRKEVA